jgi:hypothetical protein
MNYIEFKVGEVGGVYHTGQSHPKLEQWTVLLEKIKIIFQN